MWRARQMCLSGFLVDHLHGSYRLLSQLKYAGQWGARRAGQKREAGSRPSRDRFAAAEDAGRKADARQALDHAAEGLVPGPVEAAEIVAAGANTSSRPGPRVTATGSDPSAPLRLTAPSTPNG